MSRILIIDDQPDQGSALGILIEEGGTAVRILHPRDVNQRDAEDSDLILLDYDLADWPELDSTDAFCQKPGDGLAVGSVLRSQLKQLGHSSPVSFAILTGEFSKLAAPLPPENREAALAALVNMDWIFQKSSDPTVLSAQIRDLAGAVTQLPEKWDPDQTITQLGMLLGLNFGESEHEQLIYDIEACAPPIHELSEWSHGIAIVRWLLHRILPYPAFLIDTVYLAARFGVQPEYLSKAMSAGEPLNMALESDLYRGILGNFMGQRWWRSNVEAFLWKITNGNSADFEAVRHSLGELTGEKLPASEPSDSPIVCLDENFQPLLTFCREEDAVRIQPDFYPTYADQPWMRKDLARASSRMKSMVLREDLSRLE